MDYLLSPATVLAVTPILLFVSERLLEKWFSFIFTDAMSRMASDTSEAIRNIGRNTAIQAGVMTYATYGTKLQKIFRNIFIALLSLILSQYICTKSIIITTWPHLALVFLLLAFLLFLLVKLWRQQIDPAAQKSTNPYYHASLGFSFLVIILDRALPFFPEFCSSSF